MRHWRLTLLFSLAVAAGVIMYYFMTGSGEEGKIRKTLTTLTANISKPSEEGPIVLAAKAQTLENLFDERCGLEIPGCPINGSYSPQEISSNAVQIRSQFVSIRLEFLDVSVVIQEKDKAAGRFTARFEGRLKHGGDVAEIREATCALVKKGGRWLFADFKAIETLRK